MLVLAHVLAGLNSLSGRFAGQQRTAMAGSFRQEAGRHRLVVVQKRWQILLRLNETNPAKQPGASERS